MCSSAHHLELQKIEVMMKMTRIEERKNTLENEIPSYPPLASLLLSSNEDNKLDLENEENTSTIITRPLANWNKKNLIKRVRDATGYRQRAAALCVRRVKTVISEKDNSFMGIDDSKRLTKYDLEVLLVSGRGEKNYWVIPGGGIENGETKEQAVLREAREEAGIRGIALAIIGEFVNKEKFHRTSLFLVSVIEMFDVWEDYEIGRKRKWMSVEESIQKLKSSQVHMFEQGIIAALDIINQTKKQ